MDDNIPAWAVRMSATLEQIDERTSRLDHILTGNGEPDRGLIVRIDRIEQRERGREERANEVRTVAYGALGTAVVAAAGFAWKLLTGGNHGGGVP